MCERLHGFHYGCTDSSSRRAINNGYLISYAVGDSVTISYCTVCSYDSKASTVDPEDDSANGNLLVNDSLPHDMSEVPGLKISPYKLGM